MPQANQSAYAATEPCELCGTPAAVANTLQRGNLERVTPMEQRFVTALVSGKARSLTDAARIAGYAPKTADISAQQIMARPRVQASITRRVRTRQDKARGIKARALSLMDEALHDPNWQTETILNRIQASGAAAKLSHEITAGETEEPISATDIDSALAKRVASVALWLRRYSVSPTRTMQRLAQLQGSTMLARKLIGA